MVSDAICLRSLYCGPDVQFIPPDNYLFKEANRFLVEKDGIYTVIADVPLGKTGQDIFIGDYHFQVSKMNSSSFQYLGVHRLKKDDVCKMKCGTFYLLLPSEKEKKELEV